jgi:hypothetical protein
MRTICIKQKDRTQIRCPIEIIKLHDQKEQVICVNLENVL